MRLGIFVPAMIAFTPNFFHASDWDALARWWARGERGPGCAPPRAEHGGDHLVRPPAHPGANGPGLSAGPRRAAGAAPRAAVARELAVVGLIVVATNQLFDENSAAHSLIDHHNAPPVAAAVSYMDLFQGWSMFAPDAPIRTSIRGRRGDRRRPPRRSVQRGRHARASPPRAHHPRGPRPKLALLRLREPPAQPPRLLPGPEGVDPSLPGPHRAAPRTRSSRSRCSSSRTTARRSGSGSPPTCARRSCSLTHRWRPASRRLRHRRDAQKAPSAPAIPPMMVPDRASQALRGGGRLDGAAGRLRGRLEDRLVVRSACPARS